MKPWEKYVSTGEVNICSANSLIADIASPLCALTELCFLTALFRPPRVLGCPQCLVKSATIRWQQRGTAVVRFLRTHAAFD